MGDPQRERDLVEALADEFVERLRTGEYPSVAEYVAKHPECADEIRDLFPAIATLEMIVLRASVRAPGERHPSADELAAQLRRLLDDRPLRARRASRAERLWSWTRRNSLVAGLAFAAAALLTWATVVATIGLRQHPADPGASEEVQGSDTLDLPIPEPSLPPPGSPHRPPFPDPLGPPPRPPGAGPPPHPPDYPPHPPPPQPPP